MNRRKLPINEKIRETDNPDLKDAVLFAAKQYRDFTINPQKGNFTFYWNMLLGVAIMYTACVTPFDIAFFQRIEIGALFGCNQVVNMIYIVDIVIQFFVHYKELHTGRWIRDHHLIVLNYIKGAFFFDVVSSFPYGLVIAFVQFESNIRVLRLLRLLRLTKMLKMFHGLRIINKYRSSFSWSHSELHILKFISYGSIATHWIACLWGWTAHNSTANLEDSWMGKFIITDDDSPIDINNRGTQYILCLYFAVMTLTTVGYGDIVARNLVEYGVLTFTMFIGGFFWAFIIGEMCAIIANIDEIKNKFQQMFDNMNFMLKDLHVEKDVAKEVREYMLHTQESNRRKMYTQLLSCLSRDLQIKMSLSRQYRSRIDSVYYLRPLGSSLVLEIFKTLKGFVHAPNERLNRPNTLHIIVSDGFVAVKNMLLTKNQSFDHDFICYGLEPTLHIHRAGKARSYVEVDTLTRDEFFRIIDEDPYVTPDIRAYLKKNRIRLALLNYAWKMQNRGRFIGRNGFRNGKCL